MANPTAAMLVIGDEILSGRTRDANMHHLAGAFTQIGIDLKEVRVISDDHSAIVAAARSLSKQFDHVVTSGGIGPTHDDITADAIADAFHVSIDVREDAYAILKNYYAEKNIELNEARLRMARIPQNASLIDNPVSGAPGFTLENVHVLAGVPRIFQAMLENVIATLKGGSPILNETLKILQGEGDIAKQLSAVSDAFQDVSFGSYPFQEDGRHGTNIVMRGPDPERLTRAKSELIEKLEL